MYTLRRAACRLLASPSPITRSRLTALPHTHLPVVVRRPITQSRRSLGDAKSPLGSKDAPAASTATNSDTTTATATADNALDLSPPVENYAEAVEKDVMKGDLKNELELSSGTTGAATARAVSTKETKQEDGGTCKNLNLKSSDSTRNTSGVPTAPEYEAGAEKVREGRPSGTIIANTAPTGATSGVPRASSNAPGAEKAQTLNQGLAAKLSLSESLTKSTTVDEQDPDLDFDISQIREAAAQEAWAAAEKKQMTHGEKLDMLRRLQYEPKQTVFIGNLFYDVTAEDLKKQMAKYGVVEGVNIIYDSRGISKGYGYVQFSSNAAARRAIDAMHMRIFEGRRVTLYYAQTNITNSFKNKKPTNTLYIGNVPFEMTDRDLNDLVKDLDGLTDVRVTVDRQSGALRGYIHAEFLDIQSAMVAHEKLAQRRPYGRRLKIDYSKTKSAQGGFPVAV
ncbi:nucleic acid-binding protein [Aspergillus nidulans FGSC A4]|uniref:Nucleic acid-binding protein (AFU_orthologue AFUA_8G05260) n=1 Tax=Emericella nidulans (strain FGSC A4 / ATCC 38163 / CBS 112.46 / NRRL 194 / M139) TaxID=227321 RepID=C8VMQ1_EMENI|nr:hypothetical protein [Aspergillus nidulans FGSC A4]CBF85030.1 TPA: nucleic acid-binding protein (AFU_orthologue; AFUA_8G05260) [Aspergillus nidulans FGSC A4]